jgi:hypothetical protein
MLYTIYRFYLCVKQLLSILPNNVSYRILNATKLTTTTAILEEKMSYEFNKQFISFDDNVAIGNISITIETPHLTDGPIDVYGDWGPNCVFKVDPTDPLKVHYKYENHNTVNVVEMNTIEFKSPVLHETRSQFPFYLEFADDKTEYHFTIFYDQDGQARKVDFKKQTSKEAQLTA